jgi:hypothetical protein
MNKHVAIIITIILVLVMIALIYIRNSCYYHMARVKATTYLDPKTCKVEGRHLRYKLSNDSEYDLIQYGFSLAAHHKDINSKRVGGYGHTAHRLIPKGSEIDGCLAVPKIKDANLDEIKRDYYFKLKFFIMVFDLGNGKRWTCR